MAALKVEGDRLVADTGGGAEVRVAEAITEHKGKILAALRLRRQPKGRSRIKVAGLMLLKSSLCSRVGNESGKWSNI